ncbi:MAG: hypothetical protein P8Y70_20350, partial [Candidatus Lokiarchaeota archaeon]
LRIFNALKMKLNTMSKADLSNILDTLKDSILNKIGGSLALFDISKSVRELENDHEIMDSQQIIEYKSRINNWANRIAKV